MDKLIMIKKGCDTPQPRPSLTNNFRQGENLNGSSKLSLILEVMRRKEMPEWPESRKALSRVAELIFNQRGNLNEGGEEMTTSNVQTKISKVFTFSCYKGGTHITEGWLDKVGGDYAEASFAESLSPLHLMIEAFKYRPLGIKIKVTMEEID